MKKQFSSRLTVILALSFFSLCLVQAAHAARIKDLAAIKGVRENPLIGYGLVVGLNGTGDKDGVSFTTQALANMMEKMNIFVDRNDLKVKNVAAVMVTASIPPFARIGDRIDVAVSSIGDAKSLKGGTLLITPLKGVDGQVYAVAQGQVTIASPGGANAQNTHLLVGQIASGASVEQEISFRLEGKETLTLSLFHPDFTTARRMAETINASLGQDVAVMVDAGTLTLHVPGNLPRGNVAEFIADIETLTVIPDAVARVIINERTGTVVFGSDVTISGVAIAHGDLSITVAGNPETGEQVMNLPGTSTIGELVRGLNLLGVKPQDLISILQSIKAAGALQAELLII